jgi:hypothetical protein
MNQMRKDGSALRMAAFGLLTHYAYSILLFVHSQLAERVTLPFITLYLTAAGAPIVVLCVLAVQKNREGLRGNP